jgi:acetyl-CoA carboxylase carboxyl transferase subunit beta
MGLFSRSKPKIKVQTTKRDGYSGWVRCTGCSEMIHADELGQNLSCCPKCDHHYRFSLSHRIDLLSDEGSFQEMFTDIEPVDSLDFVDSEKYTDRITRAKKKTNRSEAIATGTCLLEGDKIALAIMDFSYMGGSMGSALGERLTLIIEHAIEHNLPLVVVTASGGARMQESTLSLMQMAKTSSALNRLSEKNLPYIAVLTNPTTGGVTASFATLGDIILAEPDALIAFAGPRVVEQTIGQKLPPGAQRAEFLLEKGMVDQIVPRKNLKKTLSFFVSFLHNNLEETKLPKEQMKKLIGKTRERV